MVHACRAAQAMRQLDQAFRRGRRLHGVWARFSVQANKGYRCCRAGSSLNATLRRGHMARFAGVGVGFPRMQSHRLPSTCPVNSRAGVLSARANPSRPPFAGRKDSQYRADIGGPSTRCRRIDYSRALWLLMVGQPGTFLAHTGRMRAERTRPYAIKMIALPWGHDVHPLGNARAARYLMGPAPVRAQGRPAAYAVAVSVAAAGALSARRSLRCAALSAARCAIPSCSRSAARSAAACSAVIRAA